jgi:hypothetical protein
MPRKQRLADVEQAFFAQKARQLGYLSTTEARLLVTAILEATLSTLREFNIPERDARLKLHTHFNGLVRHYWPTEADSILERGGNGKDKTAETRRRKSAPAGGGAVDPEDFRRDG